MGNGEDAAQGDKAPAPAQPGTYDQTYFLDLAAKGKDEWNAWRRDPANKGVPVTLAGIDFSEARDGIDFSGFDFGDEADFSGCRGQRRVFFDRANFGLGANFCRARFGHRGYFRATTFGHFANFSKAVFSDVAKFTCATFGDGTFGSSSNLGTSANFSGARFATLVDFSCATFNPMATFEGAIFQGLADFSGLSEDLFAEKLERSLGPTPQKTARKELDERHRNSWKQHGCRPDCFLTISFADVRFDYEAIFAGRSFEQTADFTRARFCSPPNFDGATNLGRIDFTGAHIGFAPRGKLLNWTGDSVIPVRLRTLRKLAEETKNHDLERDLSIEERKAERGVYLHQRWEGLKKASWIERPLTAWRLLVHVLWIIVMFFYGVLADYGRNVVLPAAWLIASIFFFDWR
jgi:hypothetical protein